MNGTMRSLTSAMRLRPPIMTSAAAIIIMMPVTRATMVWSNGIIAPTLSEMDTTCPMLPMPKEATTAKIENSTASIFPMCFPYFILPTPSRR